MRTSKRLHPLPLLVVLLLLSGCPGGGAGKSVPAACKELGQQCQLEPGKLGSCSYRTACEGQGCLYCQSQH
ncbi:MAG TPA: hypothetical protein VHB79_26685 [Polyangiaceae bacterium]|nr:hypothetical protein [Polyangiaceae bacterium]